MKKFLFAFLLINASPFIAAQTTSIIGFYKKNIEKELNLESEFDRNLNKTNIGETIKKLSSKPHHLGSPGQKENSEYILSLFRQWGWDAEIETFYVLFPTPAIRILEMVAPVSYKAGLKEPALKDDPTSGQKGQLPTYNAYSADGDVTSGLIYVNYGLPEDYAVLDRMGIDVKGKIVIARYGKSWRGVKPKLAQERGAVGCIIYSDPIDDGYFKGDVYPAWRLQKRKWCSEGICNGFVCIPWRSPDSWPGSHKGCRKDRPDRITKLIKDSGPACKLP